MTESIAPILKAPVIVGRAIGRHLALPRLQRRRQHQCPRCQPAESRRRPGSGGTTPPNPMAMPPKRTSGLLRAVGTHSNEVEVEVEHDEVENRSPLAA